MKKKDIYHIFCESEPTLPIFSQSWWLDAVAGENNWDICLVEKNDEVLATMPYVIKKRQGFKLLTTPLLTQTLGPWIKPSSANYSKALGQEKDLMQLLISQLPLYDHFQQNWHHTCTNWLPFYWKGFSATTRYTYQVRNISSKPVELNLFQENIRKDIRKASNRFKLRIKENPTISDFIALNKKTFQRQEKELPYSEDFLIQLDAACEKNNARKIFIAEDEDGNQHAGVYIVWNSYCAYYLMGGGDPELRNSGATSLCMYEGIKFAATVTDTFDFEGSMIEPIERFFRGFGAIQTPYLCVSHTPSKIIKAYRCLQEILAK